MIPTMLYMACTGSNYSCDNPNVDCTGGGTNSSDLESDSNKTRPPTEENDVVRMRYRTAMVTVLAGRLDHRRFLREVIYQAIRF